jgi:hypothetical protein
MDAIRETAKRPMDYAAAGIVERGAVSAPVWRDEMPTRAGWYWWRVNAERDAIILLLTVETIANRQMHSGEWAGPLESPTGRVGRCR